MSDKNNKNDNNSLDNIKPKNEDIKENADVTKAENDKQTLSEQIMSDDTHSHKMDTEKKEDENVDSEATVSKKNTSKPHQSLKKYGIIVLAATALGVGGYGVTKMVSEPAQLTTTQQKSLIDSEVVAVNSAEKPADVIKGIKPRLEKLNDAHKQQATELIYVSVQKASLYYNNAAYLMGGEITYSNNGMDALSGARDNAWLGGFISELGMQVQKGYNLNKGAILVLPDFSKFKKEYGQYASGDLKQLIAAGDDAQKYNVFGNKYVNNYDAARAFDKITKRYPMMVEARKDTKYKQDLNSLARVYHDAAFGYIQTNNSELSKDKETYQYTQESINEIKKISKSNLYLKDEAKDFLKHVNNKNQVSAKYIHEQSGKSIENFGTSVYWNSTNDITALTQQYNSANKTGDVDTASDSQQNTDKK